MVGALTMPERLRELAELAFQTLITSEEVDLITEDGDLHIVSDDWTLVLEGDPGTDAIIALEDEDGAADVILRGAISDEEFAALRNLDAQLEGELITRLLSPPDVTARTLAELLTS
jgi:nucleotide-binding universal stress UspA family protein